MAESESVAAGPGWPLSADEESLLDAADTIAHAVETGIGARRSGEDAEGSETALIAAFHTVRALRCLRSVVVACRAGYAVESAAIARSLLEDAVSLRYLSLRPESRVRTWLRFDETRSMEYWKLSERLGLGLPKSDHIRRLEDTSRPPGHPVWWSGKTPSTMAREIKAADPDLHQTFKALYPWLSDVTHANVKTTSNYYFGGPGVEPSLQIGPSNHLLHLMVDLTAGVCVRVCLIGRDLGMRVDIGPMVVAKTAFDRISESIEG